MIQQEYKNNVGHVTGQIETTGFSIEVNESMFQMLTSNVYNDTILAVMREWSTNACDACIAADKDVKFDVHLPTQEEPYFHVRDYGTGLTPEDITGLFSNLGASTKRNSNAYNGTLGIGRMAGLAVSDAFTVDSYYNGNHYSYAISMQNGVPVTLSLGTLTTSEPNGLKLSVPVEYDDLYKYVEKAEDLYKYFDHKPNLNMNVNIELDVTDHISDDWFVYTPKGNYDHTNYVVMSQVAYAIPSNSAINRHGFKNLVIKAEPGAVTFNPGRESLSLNKATVEYLNKAFNRIKDEYVQAATLALVDCNNDKELMECYYKVTRTAPTEVARNINPTPFTSVEYQQMFAPHRYSSTGQATYSMVSMTDVFKQATNNKLHITYKNSWRRNSKDFNAQNQKHYHDFFEGNHVVIDMKTKFKAALNEVYSGQDLFCWQRAGTSDDLNESVEEAKKYLTAMGIPFKLATEVVEQAGLNTKVTKTAPREGLYTSHINCRNGQVNSSQKMEEDEITSKTYLYIKMKNTTPDLTDTSKTFVEYCDAYMFLNAITDMPPVRGVAKKYQGAIKDLDNWLDFETYVKEKMKETTFRQPVTGPVPRFNSNVIEKHTIIGFPKKIREYFNEVQNYYEFCSADNFLKWESQVDLAKSFGATVEDYEPSADIDMDELNRIYPKTIPMLDASYGHRHGLSGELVRYIAKLEDFYAVHQTQ